MQGEGTAYVPFAELILRVTDGDSQGDWHQGIMLFLTFALMFWTHT